MLVSDPGKWPIIARLNTQANTQWLQFGTLRPTLTATVFSRACACRTDERLVQAPVSPSKRARRSRRGQRTIARCATKPMAWSGTSASADERTHPALPMAGSLSVKHEALTGVPPHRGGGTQVLLVR